MNNLLTRQQFDVSSTGTVLGYIDTPGFGRVGAEVSWETGTAGTLVLQSPRGGTLATVAVPGNGVYALGAYADFAQARLYAIAPSGASVWAQMTFNS